MRITYIWHDCFWIETESCHVVFDYWKDVERTEPRFIEMMDPEKPVYVFVSHHHKDHYTPEIFDWSRRFKDIRYIISRDTYKSARHYINEESLYRGSHRVRPEQVTVLRRGEGYSDAAIEAWAFGSTDTGNSYMVRLGEMLIFHAGDLNLWVRKEESTKGEIAAARRDYVKILDEIKERFPVIDYAMFPVDARIGGDFREGASIFVRELEVRHFIPMHFTLGKDLDEQLYFTHRAVDFASYANPERGDYIPLTVPYSGIES